MDALYNLFVNLGAIDWTGIATDPWGKVTHSYDFAVLYSGGCAPGAQQWGWFWSAKCAWRGGCGWYDHGHGPGGVLYTAVLRAGGAAGCTILKKNEDKKLVLQTCKHMAESVQNVDFFS